MSIVTVVAKLVAREDAVETVKAELLKLIEPTRCEPGCIDYRLHQETTDPRVFVFYENWESMACLERHTTTPHYKSYVAALAEAIVEKTVHKMTRIA
jgi:quinol monooxygenase YgiN